jgi:hypothetical protein
MSLDVPVWSPTRLQTWLRCPRSGWLSRELDAGREELQGEDIDNRTYGELLHNVHHDIIANILDFPTSEERTFDGESGYSSVGTSGLNPNEMMKIALEGPLAGEIRRSLHTASEIVDRNVQTGVEQLALRPFPDASCR